MAECLRGLLGSKRNFFTLGNLNLDETGFPEVSLLRLHQLFNGDPQGKRFEEFLTWFFAKQRSVPVGFVNASNEHITAHLQFEREPNGCSIGLDPLIPSITRSGTVYGPLQDEATTALKNSLKERTLSFQLPIGRNNFPNQVELWAWTGYNRFIFVRLTEELFGCSGKQTADFWSYFLSTGRRRLAFRIRSEVVTVVVDRYYGLGDSWKGDLDQKEIFSSAPAGALPTVSEIEPVLDLRIKTPNLSESGIYLAIPDPRLPAKLRLVQGERA